MAEHDNKKLKDIPTEDGNTIIDSLKKEGWRVASQYNLLAFDKGIDFDYYTLTRQGRSLRFEWDNWFEWQVEGDQDTLTELAERFGLTQKP